MAGPVVDQPIGERESEPLPPAAYVVALSRLPDVGPVRLRALLDAGPPGEVWRDVERGRVLRHEPLGRALGGGPAADELVRAWRLAARGIEPAAEWCRCADAGIGVLVIGQPGYPSELERDVAAPVVLFSSGDPDGLVGARVGIVGTRRCSRYGHDLAWELGHDLAAVGVGVVSGLALGIDGAAHAGCLAAGGAPPIGVVGCGLDRPYPGRHRELWGQVADAGVLLSEYPLGAAPEAWHFPQRNRIIAALSDVLVVVESDVTGGSLITAEQAAGRGVPVFAVPGPVRSAASAGTNRLIADGVQVCTGIDDVLLALDSRPAVRRSAERRPPPTEAGAVLLDAFGWQPATFEQLVQRLPGIATGVVARELESLAADGWIAARGPWFERVAKPVIP
jgi:DNA processing protein